jgi:hypothetical protein
MAIVKKLGKQYLWVDSLCINQQDTADKLQQISKMGDVYRGAYATIIALSGDSANSGLTRVGPNRELYPQLDCYVDGKRFVGLMPTLSQLVWVSPWGSRSWTLQEGLLSPRCLYISDYQMYFECNAMQCSESLNYKRSWVHQVSRTSKASQVEWSEAEIGAGVLRRPLVGGSRLKYNRLIEYGSGLALYSFRFMTNPDDALNAFSGILQDLEKEYGGSFFYGLPIPEFQWGLLWRSQHPPKQRPNFPTWSWAGWEGRLWQIYPLNPQKPHEYQPHLRIWKVSKTELQQIFTSLESTNREPQIETLFKDDPVTRIGVPDTEDQCFEISMHPSAEERGYLFVEGIIFQFSLDFSQPLTNVCAMGVNRTFSISLGNVKCLIDIMSVDRELTKQSKRSKQDFLLVARDRNRGWIINHLILIDLHNNVASRITSLSLLVPEFDLQGLVELLPRKKRFVLI